MTDLLDHLAARVLRPGPDRDRAAGAMAARPAPVTTRPWRHAPGVTDPFADFADVESDGAIQPTAPDPAPAAAPVTRPPTPMPVPGPPGAAPAPPRSVPAARPAERAGTRVAAQASPAAPTPTPRRRQGRTDPAGVPDRAAPAAEPPVRDARPVPAASAPSGRPATAAPLARIAPAVAPSGPAGGRRPDRGAGAPAEPERIVEVRIARIEVRAAPGARTAEDRPRPRRGPDLSLAEFLGGDG